MEDGNADFSVGVDCVFRVVSRCSSQPKGAAGPYYYLDGTWVSQTSSLAACEGIQGEMRVELERNRLEEASVLAEKLSSNVIPTPDRLQARRDIPP